MYNLVGLTKYFRDYSIPPPIARRVYKRARELSDERGLFPDAAIMKVMGNDLAVMKKFPQIATSPPYRRAFEQALEDLRK